MSEFQPVPLSWVPPRLRPAVPEGWAALGLYPIAVNTAACKGLSDVFEAYAITGDPGGEGPMEFALAFKVGGKETLHRASLCSAKDRASLRDSDIQALAEDAVRAVIRMAEDDFVAMRRIDIRARAAALGMPMEATRV